MNDTDALATIKGLASAGRIEIRRHAGPRDRGGLRNAGYMDIRRALLTAKRCRLQDNGNWRVMDGVDLDGDDLTCIVAIESNVVVITIF